MTCHRLASQAEHLRAGRTTLQAASALAGTRARSSRHVGQAWPGQGRRVRPGGSRGGIEQLCAARGKKASARTLRNVRGPPAVPARGKGSAASHAADCFRPIPLHPVRRCAGRTRAAPGHGLRSRAQRPRARAGRAPSPARLSASCPRAERKRPGVSPPRAAQRTPPPLQRSGSGPRRPRFQVAGTRTPAGTALWTAPPRPIPTRLSGRGARACLGPARPWSLAKSLSTMKPKALTGVCAWWLSHLARPPLRRPRRALGTG